MVARFVAINKIQNFKNKNLDSWHQKIETVTKAIIDSANVSTKYILEIHRGGMQRKNYEYGRKYIY